MVDLTGFTTEKRNANTMNLDQMSIQDIVMVMNQEDENVIKAVRSQIPNISRVIEWCTASLEQGGRIIYMGAGTSGRLGILDAAECPPTFGVSDNMVVGLIAGGSDALIKAKEGAEDDLQLGEQDLKNIGVTSKDTVIGLAASGRTPYVIGGLRYAQTIGCKTAAIVCNVGTAVGREAEIAIELQTGPEVLTGSTRLKAGTAQKMVLNMISTVSMVQIGKTYENLMVDVVQTNKKLISRAENIVMEATGCSRDMAREKLKEAGGSAKLAITSILLNENIAEAKQRLDKAKGHVRKAIGKEGIRYGKCYGESI